MKNACPHLHLRTHFHTQPELERLNGRVREIHSATSRIFCLTSLNMQRNAPPTSLHTSTHTCAPRLSWSA